MKADRVEVSWDSAKSNWLVRIIAGEEVIRRHCAAPKNADDSSIESAVQTLVNDEGYDSAGAKITIIRPSSVASA